MDEQRDAQLRAVREATEPWIARTRCSGSLPGRAPDLQVSPPDSKDAAQMEDEPVPAGSNESTAPLTEEP